MGWGTFIKREIKTAPQTEASPCKKAGVGCRFMSSDFKQFLYVEMKTFSLNND